MSIKKLLKKYKTGYAKGEVRSKEYEAKIKQEKRLNLKYDLADTMFNELNFTFTKSQKNQVKQLIKEFPNFKDLHSKATYEEIILSMIIYVKCLESQTTSFNEKLINKFADYDDFPRIFEIIMWKITLHYIQKQPITPTEPQNINHNILYKG